MSSETSATSTPRRLLRFLQPLIGVALLAFVAWLVPWRDELIVKVDGQANVEVPGAIDGDWKGDAVSFEVGESTLSELPDGVSADGALSLTRLEDGTWTREALIAFLADPEGFAPGALMPAAGFENDAERDAFLDFLEYFSNSF